MESFLNSKLYLNWRLIHTEPILDSETLFESSRCGSFWPRNSPSRDAAQLPYLSTPRVDES